MLSYSLPMKNSPTLGIWEYLKKKKQEKKKSKHTLSTSYFIHDLVEIKSFHSQLYYFLIKTTLNTFLFATLSTGKNLVIGFYNKIHSSNQ